MISILSEETPDKRTGKILVKPRDPPLADNPSSSLSNWILRSRPSDRPSAELFGRGTGTDTCTISFSFLRTSFESI